MPLNMVQVNGTVNKYCSQHAKYELCNAIECHNKILHKLRNEAMIMSKGEKHV